MSSHSAREASRRGSVVPPLAGVDRPGIEVLPNSCDVLICGTGLVESILAAALAWQGTNVLHIDSNPVYGDSSACLTEPELRQWTEDMTHRLGSLQWNPQLYVPRPVDTGTHLVDLSPHLLFAKSDLLDLLIKSRVFRYLEFKPLGQLHTYEQDNFEKVADNKEAIFTDQSMSPTAKRHLMKVIKFIAEWKIDEDYFRYLNKVPIDRFLRDNFKLDPPQITELVITIGLCDSLETPAAVALTRIRRYLMSLDVYGPFALLYSMYGSGGELSQGFCRSAAVAGATYKLGVQLTSFDEEQNIATLSDGSRVQVSEKIFLSPTQNSPTRPQPSLDKAPAICTRMVAVVSNECKEWYSEGESAALVVFPPGTVNDNKRPIHTIVYGPGSGQVPNGYSCWYLSTMDSDERKARDDLSKALERLEASILRESQTDFDLGELQPGDVLIRPDGRPVVSSLRLGQSMQNFVPKEKLQYLLKFCYAQPVSLKVCDPVPINGSKVVLETPYQLKEISYDGMVAQARKLYEAVVGSDDDFFDVDFEDEEEVVEAKEAPLPADEVMHMEM